MNMGSLYHTSHKLPDGNNRFRISFYDDGLVKVFKSFNYEEDCIKSGVLTIDEAWKIIRLWERKEAVA